MTKDKLWLLYLERNPSFLEKNQSVPVSLNSKGLKKIFDVTYDSAFKEGYNKGKTEKSVFENIFGKGPI